MLPGVPVVNYFFFFLAFSSLCLVGFHDMCVCWSAFINGCWDSMLCWVWTLPVCLHCPDVILFLSLLWQVGPCSLTFWLVLRSHGTWSGGLIQRPRPRSLWHAGFLFNIDTADHPRRFQHIYSPWKLQILHINKLIKMWKSYNSIKC
jgi:hypothetical protein